MPEVAPKVRMFTDEGAADILAPSVRLPKMVVVAPMVVQDPVNPDAKVTLRAV